MLFETFKFELQYRLKRPATYIYFGIFFLFCFLAVTVDDISIGGGTGQVKENAPISITNMMLIMSAFFMLITSSIMGVPIVRDFEHKTESLIFVNPIKKRDYLLGRFLGSFVILVFVNMGMMLGFMLGDLMPFRDASKMVDFNLLSYIHPFLVFIIPNLVFTGGVFFATGALSRKMMLVYTQGIILLVLYIMSLRLTSDLESTTVASLIDPFGIITTNIFTQYWSVAEQNSMLVSFEGLILYNRLIWLGVGIVSIIIAYFGFNFNVVQSSKFRKRKSASAEDKALKNKTSISDLPKTSSSYGFASNVYRILSQSIFYFRTIFKEIPFLAIVICGMVLMFANSVNLNRMYGTHAYPTTYSVLELISTFELFFVIILVVYAGELIWKERTVKINLIYDALPIPDFIGLVSKFLGLMLSYIVLLLALIGYGVLIQTFNGYYNYELSLYFSRLFSGTLSFLVLFTLLSFFIQVMVNHKYLGYALMVVFFITLDVLSSLGLEHSLFHFGDISLGTYSDMNGYGHFLTSFSWFDLYWFAFTLVLFTLSVMFASRGAESMMKIRWKVGKLRLNKQLLTLGLTSIITFGLSGCYIYYNTNIQNEYTNEDTNNEEQANYEKTLKKFEFLNQPKITKTFIEVDIYPAARDFYAKGYYYLKNKSNEPISDIHLQFNPSQHITMNEVTFDREATVSDEYENFDYFIYSLQNPLMPNDSVKMSFGMEFITTGFVEGNSNTNVVENGTFFNNGYFPSLGYNDGFELGDKDTREDYDLEEKERAMSIDDPVGKSMNFFGDDADNIDFEIVLSTSEDQIAIAPGYLQKQWNENGRAFFHYKMDVPMMNFYSMMSAKYEKMQDSWDNNGNPVNLEIYYHKGHEYNLDRMMNSMKKSLQYFSDNFSPYQHRQMRIMEFPRYSTFAQSFANTVPFSEGIGFMLDIQEDDVDMAYYVTAHEMAHQWWGHQVVPANVQGSAMLSETLSQYSALMVMKSVYPEEQMQKFLKYELDRYLRGRAREQKKEMPLMKVESQNYIHYRKGSQVMYALQDYIGEDSVNIALKRFINDWAFREDIYPTTEDLMPYLKAVTPDNMQYLFADMFENITLYENKTEEALYSKIDDTTYEVTLTYSSKKLLADSLGNTSELSMKDFIDIGVYGKSGDSEKNKLLYLKKHEISNGKGEIKVLVKGKPSKAGIDPINKLIDRTSDDNTKSVVLKEAV